MMRALLVSFLVAAAATTPLSSGPLVALPAEAKEWIEPPALPREIDAPRLVVHKSKREIQLLSGNSLVRTYRIALGLEPVRPKVKKGDCATPEGTYYICTKNPQSRYALALGLSYPGPADAERGLNAGLITTTQRDQIVAAWNARTRPPWNTNLGGEIMIHGHGSSWDWTSGCIALNGQDIEELYRVVPVGTSVEIRP
jgi:murein L,D-transpeptidase YafK